MSKRNGDVGGYAKPLKGLSNTKSTMGVLSSSTWVVLDPPHTFAGQVCEPQESLYLYLLACLHGASACTE